MGLNSLPVAFGVDTAKYICVGSIDATQLGVAAYLAFGLHETTYAAVLLGLVLPQIFFQVKYFLPDPIANDVTYQVRACAWLTPQAASSVNWAKMPVYAFMGLRRAISLFITCERGAVNRRLCAHPQMLPLSSIEGCVFRCMLLRSLHT